jgi:hypothetical protein
MKKRLETLLGMLETAAEGNISQELCDKMCEYREQHVHCDTCPFETLDSLSATINEFKIRLG